MSTQFDKKFENSIVMAIDAGNGTTGTALEGGYTDVFPSVMQEVEDTRMGGVGSQGFVIHIAEGNKVNAPRRSYALGETATLITTGLTHRDTSAERIGSEFQRALILGATVKALHHKVEEGITQTGRKTPIKTVRAHVDWLLNCPPVYYETHSERLYDLSDKYVVEYEDRVYTITATVKRVYPEGVGAVTCYIFDEDGEPQTLEWVGFHVGFVDGGYRTIDSGVVEKMKLNPQTTRSITDSITGVYSLMQRWAMEDFGETWTEEYCEHVLRTGTHRMRRSKELVDLEPWLIDLGERLAELIEREVFLKQWKNLEHIDRVVLAGGVANMVGDALKERYPNVVVLRTDSPLAAEIPYILMNAVGHLRLYRMGA